MHRHVTQARASHLKQWVEHVLNRLCALRILVEHDDHRLTCVHLEASIGVVAGSLGLVVDHRHGDVTQVHVRHVDVRHLMCG